MVQAQDYRLPMPGVMVHLSPPLDPPILKGIKVHPDNPFRFDFILDQGDRELSPTQLKSESSKLIKYFLASLTIPEKDLWVNLSPYEKDRIIPNSFGLTEMGRDLLAEDYMLKQITATLIYPEDQVGKKFWKRIYEEASRRYGTTDIPVNTFNKVWIVPQRAIVYENAKAGTAYVVESKLKVMLEQDYLSLAKHEGIQSAQGRLKDTNQLGSQIVREIVIPELTTEINENKNFVRLRQVYNSLILATWYKKKIRDSILSAVYADKNKVAGVNNADPKEKQKIYLRYLKAFKKGVYNYIKDDIDPLTQESIPRKYFSGGVQFGKSIERAMIVEDTPRPAMISSLMGKSFLDIAASVMVSLRSIKQHVKGKSTAIRAKAAHLATWFKEVLPVRVVVKHLRGFKRVKLIPLLGAAPLFLSTLSAPDLHAQSVGDMEIFKNDQARYNRNLSDKEVSRIMHKGFNDMVLNLKKTYGSLVPDKINAPYLKQLLGNAKTYDEIAKKIRSNYDSMSAEQRDEVVSFAYVLLEASIAYDDSSSDYANLKYAIEGNPQKQGINTGVCYTYTVYGAMILNDFGVPKVWKIEITINFDNKTMRDKGGHTALAYQTVDGGPINILDGAQGYNGEINTKVAHIRYAIVRNGIAMELPVNQNALVHYPGLSFDEIRAIINEEAEIHDLYVNVQKQVVEDINNSNPDALAAIARMRAIELRISKDPIVLRDLDLAQQLGDFEETINNDQETAQSNIRIQAANAEAVIVDAQLTAENDKINEFIIRLNVVQTNETAVADLAKLRADVQVAKQDFEASPSFKIGAESTLFTPTGERVDGGSVNKLYLDLLGDINKAQQLASDNQVNKTFNSEFSTILKLFNSTVNIYNKNNYDSQVPTNLEKVKAGLAKLREDHPKLTIEQDKAIKDLGVDVDGFGGNGSIAVQTESLDSQIADNEIFFGNKYHI